MLVTQIKNKQKLKPVYSKKFIKLELETDNFWAI